MDLVITRVRTKEVLLRLTEGAQGQPDVPLGVRDKLPHVADRRRVNHSAYQWCTKETLARLDHWNDPFVMVLIHENAVRGEDTVCLQLTLDGPQMPTRRWSPTARHLNLLS